MAALLALLSSAMWGTSDFLGGVVARRIPALAVYGGSQVVGFVLLVIVATVTGGWGTEPGYWPWAIAASVTGLVGMVTFYSALAIGPMGIVSPLVSLSVAVPVIVSLFRGEQPSVAQLVGIGVAVIGILLASGPELSGAESMRPILLAGVATLSFGAMYILMAGGSEHDPLMTMTGMRITSALIILGLVLVTRSIGGIGTRDVPALVVIGVFDAGANLAFGVATTLGLLSVTSVLGSLYPVITAVLAAVFLRERLRGIQYLGVVVAIAGVVTIAAAG